MIEIVRDHAMKFTAERLLSFAGGTIIEFRGLK